MFLDIKNERPLVSLIISSLREAQLHLKPKVFFTSSPNSGSLACEDAPFHSACEGVSFRYHSIALVKFSPFGSKDGVSFYSAPDGA